MRLSITLPAVYTTHGLSLDEAYRALRGCGFRHVNITLSPCSGADYFDRHFEAVCAADMDVTSLRVEGNPFSSQAESDFIKNAVSLAAEKRIQTVIVPLGTEADIGHYDYLDRNEAYLRDMLGLAEKTNTQLLIENAGSFQIPHYSHHARELRLLTERIDSPLLGVNVSTGNLGLSEAQPYPQIKLLGSLVRGVDFSDNFGAMPVAVQPERQNLQMAPMMGAIDFDQVMQALTEIGYNGICNMTVNLPKAPYLRYVSTGREKYSLSIINRLYAWVFNIGKSMLKAYDVYEEA